MTGGHDYIESVTGNENQETGESITDNKSKKHD